MAGTLCRFTWLIRSATSLGVGSSKFDTWMAPMIFQR